MHRYEDDMICDLAETYGVYDYKQLPPKTVAVFVVGLGEKSRIKKKITGVGVSLQEQLLAVIADRMGQLINAWGGKIDGSIYNRIMGMEESRQTSGAIAFSSVEEFNKARYGG